ncbi:MAG: hypothetical protein FJ090_12025 [Deltaproteobacteria bacterium]|nr:hypothetical protein [Deltaproteobacteria bacterium]
MRVLVVHHGQLAGGDGPTTGGAIRAAQHVRALRRAGHEVHALARAQDEPGGFTGPRHLAARARGFDWVLCVSPEEAPSLKGVAPLVVDLYAPRLLEAAWQGEQEDAAQRTLLAIDAADEVLFSNPRQRWFYLGLLAACGWDVSRPVGHVVPLAVEPIAPGKRARKPIVVCGGYPWPWQDARDTLARAAAHLGKRAELRVVGLDGAMLRRAEWQALCARADVALDRYAHHVERELALSFRQIDYLSAGLPIVSDPWTPLADELRREGAGWVDESLEDALDRALLGAEASRDGVARVAAHYREEVAYAAVEKLAPSMRARPWTALRWSRQAAAAVLAAREDRRHRDAAEAEVLAKRAEVEALHAQVAALATSVAQLSAAMADVAAFRRETVAVLGTRLAGQTEEAEHLRRELAIAQADLEKKQLELDQLRAERDRLGGVLRRLGR